MSGQTTGHIMMVRPFRFGYNAQTERNNYFQKKLDNESTEAINEKAIAEFDALVVALREAGVSVIVFQDDAFPETPDAIFPNNWVSFHEDGRVALYPMFAENRRHERREEMLDIISDDFQFEITEVEDFAHLEEEGIFLESTGSMVLDRQNRIAYMSISERSDEEAFETFCDRFDYDGIVFHANQHLAGKKMPVYHTNVMMAIADKFCIVCLNAIDNEQERQVVRNSIKKSGRKIIDISEVQMNQFAGNALALSTSNGKDILLMSASAHQSLRPDQTEVIEKHSKILSRSIPTIETIGGGSVRCMIAEIFLPKQNN